MIKFNDEQGAYTLEIGEIVFRWEKEPAEDYENQAKIIAANYKSNLSRIIEFMHTDIQEMYGNISLEEIEEKLGKPMIDIDNGQVTYCEQTFDDIHIFSFEFLDDEFNEMQYFSIVG